MNKFQVEIRSSGIFRQNFLAFLENLNCIIKMHEIVIAPSEKFLPQCDILFVQNSKKREFITPRRFPQTGLIFREKKWHLTFYMHSSENRAGYFFHNSRKLHWNPDPVKLSFVLLAAQCCGFLFAFLHQFVYFQENGKKKSSSKRTNVLLVLVPLNCIW